MKPRTWALWLVIPLLLYAVSLRAQNVKVIQYDYTSLLSQLEGLDEEWRTAFVRAGFGDSVKISGLWHHRFNIPNEKVYINPDGFTMQPTDSALVEWWTTGGKDWFGVLDGDLVDPDTLRYVEATFSKKPTIVKKTIVKNGKYGIIDVKGIPSVVKIKKHKKEEMV